jgi:hypothetical protein
VPLADLGPKLLCLAAGLVVAAFLAYRRWRAPRGEPLPPGSSRRLVRAVLRSVGPPCWALALGLFGNRLLDNAPPVEQPSRLLRVTRPSKGPDRYYVASWRPGRQAELLLRPGLRLEGVHGATPPGTPLVVVTHPGAFGWEWVGAVRRATPGDYGGAQLD